MDNGVKRLHAPVEHLGKAGDFRNVGHLEARLTKGLGGAPRADQLIAAFDEPDCELDDTRLVGNR